MTRDTGRIFDELLLISARAGDRRAGERLAARWQPRLLRTARRLLRDEDEAVEAVQNAWAAICRGWFPARPEQMGDQKSAGTKIEVGFLSYLGLGRYMSW